MEKIPGSYDNQGELFPEYSGKSMKHQIPWVTPTYSGWVWSLKIVCVMTMILIFGWMEYIQGKQAGVDAVMFSLQDQDL